MTAATTLPVFEALEAAWERSDLLFSTLRDADQGLWHARPIPLRHPPIFYLGHLPAFAWNQIGAGLLGRMPIDADLDRLFERGIDPLSDEAAAASRIEAWPSRRETEAYRDTVRSALRRAVDAIDAESDDPLARGHRIIHLVLEHELMHHETLIYLLMQAPCESLAAPHHWPAARPGGAAVRRDAIPVAGGALRIGVDFDDQPFGWDNEFGNATVEVEAFSLDRVPVTCGEFAAFIAEGGYQDRALWGDAGWRWQQARGAHHPADWRQTEDGWRVRSLFEEHALEDVHGWPVHVSHAEAEAFATWAGARLPTEAELRLAAYGPNGSRAFPWGDELPEGTRSNLGFHVGGRVPVGSLPAGATPEGIHELVGNGWEWTATPFAPLPGFTPWARTYPGYSADFFDGQHNIVFGASWATDARLARSSFRNWYQPRYPYAFTTFRLAHAGK